MKLKKHYWCIYDTFMDEIMQVFDTKWEANIKKKSFRLWHKPNYIIKKIKIFESL